MKWFNPERNGGSTSSEIFSYATAMHKDAEEGE
jgi:hypothetical protein